MDSKSNSYFHTGSLSHLVCGLKLKKRKYFSKDLDNLKTMPKLCGNINHKIRFWCKVTYIEFSFCWSFVNTGNPTKQLAQTHCTVVHYGLVGYQLFIHGSHLQCVFKHCLFWLNQRYSRWVRRPKRSLNIKNSSGLFICFLKPISGWTFEYVQSPTNIVHCTLSLSRVEPPTND